MTAEAPTWTVDTSDALDWLKSKPTDWADLAVTSPPYTGARTYGIKAQRSPAAWVEWLRPIVVEMCRVSRLVALNVSDQVKDFRYGCGDLWLIADLTRLDGLQLGPAPYAWVRPGVSGSGGPHYHRRDWEPVYLLARPESLPPKWSENTAWGKPPKYAPGGEMSHRLTNGCRINKWGSYTGGVTRRAHGGRKKKITGALRKPDGHRERLPYDPPTIANPGSVIRTRNGGGQLGHELAHENEAPMNLALAERFVSWFCPPGGRVIDPFTGSGTTGHASIKHRRNFSGCDVRESQVKLASKRLGTIVPELFV